MDEFAGMVFAIVQAVNATSGLRMVHITGSPNQAACEELISGATEIDYDNIFVERAECVTRVPGDYMQALLNKPIPNALILSYEFSLNQRDWPARHLFYGVAEDYQTTEGCDAFIVRYRHLSTDVKCINGYD